MALMTAEDIIVTSASDIVTRRETYRRQERNVIVKRVERYACLAAPLEERAEAGDARRHLQ